MGDYRPRRRPNHERVSVRIRGTQWAVALPRSTGQHGVVVRGHDRQGSTSAGAFGLVVAIGRSPVKMVRLTVFGPRARGACWSAIGIVGAVDRPDVMA